MITLPYNRFYLILEYDYRFQDLYFEKDDYKLKFCQTFREIYEMNKYSTFNVSQRNHIDMYFYFHKLSHKKRGKTDILKLYKHDIAMIIQ